MVASKQNSRSYAISTHGRWRTAYTGKIRTMKPGKKHYANVMIKDVRRKKHRKTYFHCLQGTAFPEICGRLTAERYTWDHKHNDRDDQTYMHATNLGPANRSEQSLNQRTRRVSEAEMPLLEGEIWRTLVLPGGEVVPQCEVSDMGRYRNSYRRTYTPQPACGMGYANISVQICSSKHFAQFHNCVAATFEDIIGSKPGDEYTIGHQDIDATNNKVSNLQWEDRSTQQLNKSNSENWIEGRRVGQEEWIPFRNSGRAAVKLQKLEPEKNWYQGNIYNVANGGPNTHQGWEFRFREPEKAVRKATSAPCEGQWRDEPEYAGEQWARLEPLGDRRFRVIPEHRDGTEGASFEVDLNEFRGDDSASGSSEEN